MNLHEILDFAADRFPDKEAVVYAGGEMTYKQLKENANKFANYLLTKGLQKGDKVALISFNTPETLVSFFGILKAGGVAVPINYKSQSPEIRYLVEHSDSSFVVYDQSLSDVILKGVSGIKALRGGVSFGNPVDESHTSYKEIIGNYTDITPELEIKMTDVAEIIYTSGTTGNPKGCVLTHYNIFLVAFMAAGTFGLNVNSRTLHAMPLYHSAPLNLMMLGTTLVGGTHILLREYHPQYFLDFIEKQNVTHTFAAPIALLMPMQLPNFNSYNLNSIELWVYGGGPISKETAQLVMQKYKSDKFMQVYGLSESGPNGSYLAPKDQVIKAGSIGFCGTMNVHLKVVNKHGDEVKPDEVGEIIIQSETNMKEYYKNPSATQETLRDGWVYTGDLARCDKDGYIFIVDRKKDMIVTGGENVYTKEVEDVLLQNPSIAQAAVFGVPHNEWGETVAAALVLKPNSSVSSGEILDSLKNKIAKFKIPRIIKFYSNLPLTPTGKVIKYRLRSDYLKERS